MLSGDIYIMLVNEKIHTTATQDLIALGTEDDECEQDEQIR